MENPPWMNMYFPKEHRGFSRQENIREPIECTYLVGGFNQVEKKVKMGIFPQGYGWKYQKLCELPPPRY